MTTKTNLDYRKEISRLENNVHLLCDDAREYWNMKNEIVELKSEHNEFCGFQIWNV